METKLLYGPLENVEADAVAAVLFEEEPPPADLKSVSAWLSELSASGEFTGKAGELTVLHQPQGLRAKRLVVAGGGKRVAFDAAALRKAAGAVTRAVKQKGVKRLAWWLGNGDAAAVVEGAVLGNFEPDRYKTSSDCKFLEAFLVNAAAPSAEIERSFERGRMLAD